MGNGNISISVIIPLFNEGGNIGNLYSELKRSLSFCDFEIIFVNDGSTDATENLLRKIASEEKRVKLINFTRNFGQSAAFQAGFDIAQNDYIATMDGDMQNDPNDLKPMVEMLEKTGSDIVVGWRVKRNDPLTKRIPSFFANRLISKVLGLKIHDTGCSIKVFKKSLLHDLRLFGEMHRFIPYLLYAKGYKVEEIKVNHRKRFMEKTKYGLNRTFKVLLDLITVKFLNDYSTNPIYALGGLSLFTMLMSAVAFILLLLMKIAWNIDMTGNPLLIISVFLFLISIQMIMLGLMSEIQIRIYFETAKRDTYKVRDFVNVNKE